MKTLKLTQLSLLAIVVSVLAFCFVFSFAPTPSHAACDENGENCTEDLPQQGGYDTSEPTAPEPAQATPTPEPAGPGCNLGCGSGMTDEQIAAQVQSFIDGINADHTYDWCDDENNCVTLVDNSREQITDIQHDGQGRVVSVSCANGFVLNATYSRITEPTQGSYPPTQGSYPPAQADYPLGQPPEGSNPPGQDSSQGGSQGQYQSSYEGGYEGGYESGYNTQPECSDGVDNNGNGLIDVADPTCTSSSDVQEEIAVKAALSLASLSGKDLVRKGTPATIVWSATNIVTGSCTLNGDNGDHFTLAGTSGNRVTSNLTNSTKFTLTCTQLKDGKHVSAETTVGVAPTYKEI